MNRKISLGSAIAFAAIVAAVTICITIVFFTNVFNHKLYNIGEKEALYSKIADIDHNVRYLYNGEIDEDYLMDSIARGYMAGLNDPEARYLTMEEYRQTSSSASDNLVGIGAEFSMDNSGYILITAVYPDSPAELAGLEAGDIITQVDGQTVTSENYDQLSDGIRGEAGSLVTLVVRSENEDEEIEVARRFVEVPTVSTQMDEGIGYLKISAFTSGTPNQFSRELSQLQEEGAQVLVLDVRGNNSGTLDSMVQVLDELVPAGPMIASTDKDGNVEILAESDAREVSLPMVVLVDEDTTCFSELFAQALRDFGKANIVGATTAGKCSEQRDIQLEDGSAIRLTVADYHTPSGTVLNDVGVKPDYEVTMTEEQKLMAENDGLLNDTQYSKAKELALAFIRMAESAS